MNNLVIFILLIFPGYISLLYFQFFTGIRIKNTLTLNIISIFIGFLGLLELNFFPLKILYLKINLINSQSPVKALFDYKIILILFLLSSLCFLTTVILRYLFHFINSFLIKYHNRSFTQNIFFYYVNKYIKKTNEKDSVNVLIKMESGSFLYGTIDNSSDNEEYPYIYLLSVVELANDLTVKHYYTEFETRSKDGILIDRRKCEFIAFNVKDEIIKEDIINHENCV